MLMIRLIERLAINDAGEVKEIETDIPPNAT